MKYRVITVAPLGDGALLVRCQEPTTCCLESSSPVLFLHPDLLYSNCKSGGLDQWLRAFSSGFNHLIKITHT
jgi:hypothetical protein